MADEWPHLRAEHSPTGPTERTTPSIEEQWEAKAAEALKSQQAASTAKSNQAASGIPAGWNGVDDRIVSRLLALPEYQAATPVIDINMPELELMRWLIDCDPHQYDSARLTKTMLLLATRYPTPQPIMEAAMNCIAAKKNVMTAQETIKVSGERSRQLWDMVNTYLTSKGRPFGNQQSGNPPAI
jgi:hypothetical protein